MEAWEQDGSVGTRWKMKRQSVFRLVPTLCVGTQRARFASMNEQDAKRPSLVFPRKAWEQDEDDFPNKIKI